MAKDPAFLFYYDRFISGTYSMTNEDVGAYIRLLCIQANKGSVTLKELVNNTSYSSDKDVFNKFTEISPGVFRNEVLFEIMEDRKKFTESRRSNRLGKKSFVKEEELVNNTSKTLDKLVVNVNKDVDKDLNENNEGVQGEKFLIPQMWEVWKSVKPKYPADKKKDFEPLKKIAQFICGQERISWMPTDATETAQILTIWRTLGEYIDKDNFFKKYSLEQVERHIQSISQSFQENKHKTFKDIQNESREAVEAFFRGQ